MYLPSTDCLPVTCPNERFDITASSTIEITTIEDAIYVSFYHIILQYAIGEVYGYIVYDTVALDPFGEFAVTRFPFLAVYDGTSMDVISFFHKKFRPQQALGLQDFRQATLEIMESYL